MAKEYVVPIQKGPIEVPFTRQNMFYSEKQAEAQKEADMNRDFKSPTLKKPKK